MEHALQRKHPHIFLEYFIKVTENLNLDGCTHEGLLGKVEEVTNNTDIEAKVLISKTHK